LLSDGENRGSVGGLTSWSDRAPEAVIVPIAGETSSKNPVPKKTDTIKAATTPTETK
jgi:hypothetical protein